MSIPFFTIGHSNRSPDGFIELIRECRAGLVIDVRKLPGSTRYPHFNQAELSAALNREGIGYEHLAGLAGRRPASSTVPREVNAWWENRSFHNYADYALSDEFTEELEKLRREARKARLALMCSEAVWWRCHRRIISDYLLARGEEVTHIMGRGRVEPAVLSSGAVIRDDLGIEYPATA